MVQKLLMIRFESVGVTVAVSPGTSLFEAARRARMALPSICGGQGDCGECRVWVLEGEVTPITKEEEEHLGPSDLKKGMRLACCTRVHSAARILV